MKKGGRDLPPTITKRDGRRRVVRVAFYEREGRGAILAFRRPDENVPGGGYWADGYAYCASLPEALAAAGAPLPRQAQ